jgi:hypothetical protein
MFYVKFDRYRVRVEVSDGLSSLFFNVFDHLLHYVSVEAAGTSVRNWNCNLVSNIIYVPI